MDDTLNKQILSNNWIGLYIFIAIAGLISGFLLSFLVKY